MPPALDQPENRCHTRPLASGPVTDRLPAPTTGPLAPADRAPVEPQRLSALEDLVRGFLLSKRSPQTRTAYAADLASWLTFCAGIDLNPLTAGIHHADAYLRLLAESGDPRSGRRLAPASIARRTSALHGFYRYATRQHAVAGSPFTDVERPRPDDDHATTRLSTTERRQLRAAARADGPRADALITLLLTNGLRISEATAARIDDLTITEGHPGAALPAQRQQTHHRPADRHRPGRSGRLHRPAHRRTHLRHRHRHRPRPGRRLADHPPPRPPRRHHPPRTDQPALDAGHLHHHPPRRRRPTARRAGLGRPRRPAHPPRLRPQPQQPRPPRHLHSRRRHGRRLNTLSRLEGHPVVQKSASGTPNRLCAPTGADDELWVLPGMKRDFSRVL